MLKLLFDGVLIFCFCHFQFFLAPPERCVLPRWYSGNYQDIYNALVRLVPRFPVNLHLLPVYATDFTMFESGECTQGLFFAFYVLILCVFNFAVLSLFL